MKRLERINRIAAASPAQHQTAAGRRAARITSPLDLDAPRGDRNVQLAQVGSAEENSGGERRADERITRCRRRAGGGGGDRRNGAVPSAVPSTAADSRT